MLSVSIVLIAIVGTINIANYITTNQALDARLSLIADNGGTFPDMTPGDSGKKLEPKTDQPPKPGMIASSVWASKNTEFRRKARLTPGILQ